MLMILICIFEFVVMIFLHRLGIANDELAISIVVILFSLLDCVAIDQDPKLESCKTQIIIGLLFRVALLFFDRYGKAVMNLPNSGTDSEGFFRTCLRIVASGIPRSPSDFEGLMSFFMFLVGTSRLNAQFIVINFSLFSLIFTSYALRELCIEESIKGKVFWVISLLPNYAILGSIFLRESLVSMCVALSCYCFARWLNRGGVFNILFAFLSVLVGMQYHSGIVGIAVAYIVVMILYNTHEHRMKLNIGGIFAAMIFVLAFSYFYNNSGEQFFSKMLGVNSVDDIANTSTEGGSSYSAYVGNSQSIISMILYTPLRFIYFLFSPFPWQIRGIADIIAFLFSSLFYIYTIYMSVKKTKNPDQHNRTMLIIWLFISLTVVFVFAWGTSNTGTATRHRDKLIPIFSVILSLALAGNPVNQRNVGSKYIKD